MTSKERVAFYASNGGWGVYFLLWCYARTIYALSIEGPRVSVEVLLILQHLMLFFFFVVRHPSKNTSWNPLDITWAFLGGFGMTLCVSTTQANFHLGGLIFQCAGTLLAIYAGFSLGRSWGVIPAKREIRTGGLFQFVRHPIYMSYLIFSVGYLINQPSYFNFTIAIVCFLSQILRIFAEERLLTQDSKYVEYRSRVRWRMIPYIF